MLSVRINVLCPAKFEALSSYSFDRGCHVWEWRSRCIIEKTVREKQYGEDNEIRGGAGRLLVICVSIL